MWIFYCFKNYKLLQYALEREFLGVASNVALNVALDVAANVVLDVAENVASNVALDVVANVASNVNVDVVTKVFDVGREKKFVLF